jgi:hypothetical protein
MNNSIFAPTLRLRAFAVKLLGFLGVFWVLCG